MASFMSLTSDRLPLEAFKAKLPKITTAHHTPNNVEIPLHLFQWSESGNRGSEIGGIRSMTELETYSQPTVRILFAPQDVPTSRFGDGLLELFERSDIPTAFVAESLQNVSQSFGARKDMDGTTNVWFHMLCKDVKIDEGRIVHQQRPGETDSRQKAQKQSQANFFWTKPGFVLKIKSQRSMTPVPNRTTTSSSDSTLAVTPSRSRVELFCFGAPITLRDRFQKFKGLATCDDLLQDPYVLLEIVLEEMYKVLDATGWAIADVFGHIETRTFGMASAPGKAVKDLPNDHFTGLHNLAKHTIYLRENCESALATLEALQEHHNATTGDHPNQTQEFTREALRYRKTLFQSTQRRLASLDKRMTNIIQLSFHIVTQGDSRLMQSESQSMKTIAVMTLVFMPLGTVAAIFGTQFMKLEDEKPYRLRVSNDFWLLWLIAVPLTVLVMIIWRMWYTDAKARAMDARKEEGGCLGWKTFGQVRRNDEQQGMTRAV
ncbi:hypothetical protein P153DRAFT_341599 [Dothidotthia symphoricarpi CBS 119687]|uniref:Mg2+ transporter protein n=1 Tax=Dothidotthia symphoricarpi CBS 119687 TaxID=1392245 RepID=A0A6A6AB99_9PLEO|nr:uncharacterized protein P153DRAFT_341599 [Dothidotthia symphoricarpi CBS 119687]KAF2129100.1 hypothetical protein P153DRAFT_341599 [Dothidotthia symphoricarpi CBS 119687]